MGNELSAEFTQVPKSSPEELLTRIRSELKQRGVDNIASIGRRFRIIDDDHDGKISKPEFEKACHEAAIGLSAEEMQDLWAYCTQNGSNFIAYEDFLRGVRGPLNSRRQAIVDMAFKVVDVDGSGIIDINDLLMRYNADNHPDVKQSKTEAIEIFRKFINTFDVGGVRDGQVTSQEFRKYYEGVSASIDADDYFEQVVRSAWKFSN